MLFRELSEILKKLLPPETAMNGDRIGTQIEGSEAPVRKILTTLEVTDEVIEEAKKLNIDTIITFHPLIFMPLEKIENSERVGRLTKKIIKNDINLYSVHTSFDAFENGTSKIIADKLNLINNSFLVPDENYETKGMGVVGEFATELLLDDFLEKVSKIMKSPLRYNYINNKIKKVAILGGSGSSFIDDAIKTQADAFITADVSYHKFHYISGQMMIIDPGHYEMEQFVAQGMKELISNKLPDDIIIEQTEVLTNPVKYYPDTEKYLIRQNNYLINK